MFLSIIIVLRFFDILYLTSYFQFSHSRIRPRAFFSRGRTCNILCCPTSKLILRQRALFRTYIAMTLMIQCGAILEMHYLLRSVRKTELLD